MVNHNFNFTLKGLDRFMCAFLYWNGHDYRKGHRIYRKGPIFLSQANLIVLVFANGVK